MNPRKLLLTVLALSTLVVTGAASATGWPDPDDAYCSTHGTVKICRLR
ncbi:hypothetical protein [uncultured Deinococcus sp.]|nr:hypothetical protein [uncultured Deinococcus sp.]